MASPYIERILKARVYDVAIESPLEEAARLSRRLGNQVLLKREDLQPVFSFKLRGAYNRIAHLSEAAAQRGVVCASAGNHAQGVALAARRRGCPAVVVMPETTPHIKLQAVIDLGAELTLHGDDYDSAFEHALRLERERNLVFVHPFDDPDAIVEPAGALAVAGVKKYLAREGWRGKRLVAIASGANMNFDRLRHVAERADLGGEREALLAVVIPERPGSFLHFCEVLGRRSVTEFNYRYASAESAQIFVGLALSGGRAEKDAVVRTLREGGYAVTDMSNDEMAKLHVRYMVGGHARGIRDELLYRFEFPERPGALLKFLQAIGARWNISLFHYRNHGSDHGRVLAGIQVLPAERTDFLQHLNVLHYAYVEETANPSYRMFLGA